ncbi:uncharacterized protein LOC126735871 [Anthonomus grandis grandis]|uniref:uncharacterized protein LOC126735871 n=1 Tax=Anthonomus grandis grandis TaxID=2921223 RepID=UPI00216645A6|nr:uncharacterized protein LOC126735871 [Anthonomus grandis grandis]
MVSKLNKILLIVAATVLVSALVVCVVLLVMQYGEDGLHDDGLGCEIDPFEVDLHPLILHSGTTKFLYPTWPEKTLKFTANQPVDFVCPGRELLLGSSRTNRSLLTGKCINGTRFVIDNDEQVMDWNMLECITAPFRTLRATNQSCSSDGRELEVGFLLPDARFVRSLLICFKWELQIPYWTYIEQTASINQRVLGTPRPSWLQGSGVYTIGSVTNIYLRRNQRATINNLLGLNETSTKYIQDNSNYYLARGHLTARSDNFYAAQQNATFFMQNIAPQWQTFNGFNWNQVEIDVRDYAANHGVDLQVWTGVHGVTTLPHEKTGEPVELYLFVNSTLKALPVPEIFYKIAYNPLTERGVALIGVNNPYNGTYSPICYDVSSQIKWLNCDKTSQRMGFCYACSITTLRYVVISLPDISDRGLLL